MVDGRTCLVLRTGIVVLWVSISLPVFAQVEMNSGHHYSWIEGARIGHDFGRDPWRGGSQSFATSRGRSRLRRSLENAVAAGETRLSFDFGFDFRSIVVVEDSGHIELDTYAMPSIEAFLEEVEAADAKARVGGRRFGVDVVLTDYRMADRVNSEGNPPVAVGEHPEFITYGMAKCNLLDALSPALERLGKHPLVTLALMNEPEFVALPASKAVALIRNQKWASVVLVRAGKQVAGARALFELEKMGTDVHVTVQGNTRLGRIRLVQTGITEGLVDEFLLDLHRAILKATTPRLTADFDGNDAVDFSDFLRFSDQFGATTASVAWDPAFDLDPDGRVDFSDFLRFAGEFGQQATSEAKVTIGWRNDQSALEGTGRLERAAGEVVTPVISFHVYGVVENPFHPLTKTRLDFEQAGFKDRSIRITEWGLGSLEGQERIQREILNAFQRVQRSGLEGVLFWWDDVHVFGQEAYQNALGAYREAR